MPGSWHECHLSVGLAGRGATILKEPLGIKWFLCSDVLLG